jgi:peroxiredoxin
VIIILFRKWIQSMTALSSLTCVLLVSAALAYPTEPTRVIADFTLRDYRGAERSLREFADRKLVVIAFVGTECPLARLYGTRCGELARQYEPRGVAFIGISSNQQDSVTALGHFAREHKIDFPILKDVNNVVADRFGAERTPEVFVLDGERKIRYRGRVDDQYGIGYNRPKAEHRYLRDALDRLLAGKPVSASVTEAEGCFIGRVQQPARDGPITYCKQIAPILQRRCIECHHQGAIGPFPLTSYEDTVAWAQTIREVVKKNRMPPWHPDPRYGHFVNDARMPDNEKEQIYQWVKSGAPEGDPKDLPPPVRFEEGWRIPKPDLVISLPKPFTVPASGDVVYQFLAVETGFTEDKWVRAAEIRPSNRSVVHHVLVFVQPPGGDPSRRGFASHWLAANVPGARPQICPLGMAKRIPAGSRLLFQIHYTTTGTVQTDQTCLGLVFADPKSVEKEVISEMVHNTKFEIPPGDNDYEVTADLTLEQDTTLLSMTPHTHLRGKSFRYEAIYPDGQQEILLDVPHYDFNWQNTYVLEKPKRLPRSTTLHCVAHYDNSKKNFSNPNPGATVRWGDQTWEEMMIGYFDMVRDDQDLRREPRRPAPATSKAVPLDATLKRLAQNALASQAAFEEFAIAVKKAVPEVDRVCVTDYVGDKLRVERAAYPGDVKKHFAETGFEVNGRLAALAHYALLGINMVHDDLRDRKKARGMDLAAMSDALASSLHVSIVLGDRPATVNFWSNEPKAFSQERTGFLKAVAKEVVHKS